MLEIELRLIHFRAWLPDFKKLIGWNINPQLTSPSNLQNCYFDFKMGCLSWSISWLACPPASQAASLLVFSLLQLSYSLSSPRCIFWMSKIYKIVFSFISYIREKMRFKHKTSNKVINVSITKSFPCQHIKLIYDLIWPGKNIKFHKFNTPWKRSWPS